LVLCLAADTAFNYSEFSSHPPCPSIRTRLGGDL